MLSAMLVTVKSVLKLRLVARNVAGRTELFLKLNFHYLLVDFTAPNIY